MKNETITALLALGVAANQMQKCIEIINSMPGHQVVAVNAILKQVDYNVKKFIEQIAMEYETETEKTPDSVKTQHPAQ